MTNTLPTVRDYAKAIYKSASSIYSRLKKAPEYSTKEGKVRRLTQAYLDRYAASDGFGLVTFDELADSAQDNPDLTELTLVNLHNQGARVLLPKVKPANVRDCIVFAQKHTNLSLLELLVWAAKENNLPVFASIYNSLTSADYTPRQAEETETTTSALAHPNQSFMLFYDVLEPEPVVITDDAVEVRATEVTEAEVTNGTLECLRSKAYDGEFASPSEVAPSKAYDTGISPVANAEVSEHKPAQDNTEAEENLSPYHQALADIEKAKALVEDISKQKPSKARDKRLGTAQLAVSEAHVPLLHCLYPKLQTHEYKLADYREIADQLTCTNSLLALDWYCLTAYENQVFRKVYRKYQGERAIRELKKAQRQIEETRAYIKERWQTVANTTTLDIAGFTVEATRTKADTGYHYSFRVCIAPGIYSRYYQTNKAEDTIQLAQDYPAIARDNFMEAYLSLPRVSLGEETLVQLPTGGVLREVGGMVDLSSLGGAFGLTED